nr:AAA family ATPase [Actinomycetales bacterium]
MLQPATSPAMVGRAPELEALRRTADASLGGTPRGVVVAGEAGIGKTRLLSSFLSELDPAVIVARGQCVAMGSLAQPFAPLRGLLRDLVSLVGAEALLAAAGPPGRLLPVLLPELAEGDPGEISEEQLHDAVGLLLQNLSQSSPIVAVVEDIHWADVPTLDLLRNLLHTLRRGRVALIVSYRTDDVGRHHPLRPFLLELDRAREVTRIDLARLTAEETAEQVRQILGSRPVHSELEPLVERSDGIPFFVEELLALPGSTGSPGGLPTRLPATLRELVLARYDRVSEPAQAVLRLLSAGGIRVEHELVEQIHGGAGAAFEDAIREAVAAHILSADGSAYTFRHALTQEGIHEELLPGERTRFHSRYAEALEHNPLATAAGRSAEIAHHWLAAQNQPKALAALTAAAQEAAASGAPQSAGQLGERALELWPQVPNAEELVGFGRSRLFVLVADQYGSAGDPRALAVLDEGLAEVPESDRHGRALLLHEAMVEFHAFGRPGGVEFCRQALELLPEDEGDDEGAAIRLRVLCGLGILLRQDRGPEGRATLEDAVRLARALAARTTNPEIAARAEFELVRALTNLGTERMMAGEVEEGFANLDEALARAGEDPVARLRHAEQASSLQLDMGRYEESLATALTGHAFSRTAGMERGWGAAIATIAGSAMAALGQVPRAWDYLQAIDTRSTWIFAVYCSALGAELSLLRDDLAAAEQAYREIEPSLADLRSNTLDDHLFARLLALLALARGDLPGAWAEVERLWVDGRPAVPGPGYRVIHLGAVVLSHFRRRSLTPPGMSDAEAERRLRHALDQTSVWEVAEDWRALVDAELSGPDGTGTDVAAWERAVAASGRGRMPRDLYVAALLRLAAARLEAGDRAGAVEPLREARTLAEDSDLRRLLREIGDLEVRAGIAPPGGGAGPGGAGESVAASEAAGVAGEAPLTAREQQVLELVAQGLSNRQIGARLFISDKTASVHVSAILRKLGAATRAEAAAIAARTGLTSSS